MNSQEGRSTLKRNGEKLVKCTVVWNSSTQCIDSIRLCGDFFIHPETGIETIEGFFSGKLVTDTTLADRLESLCHDEKIQLFGVSSTSFVEALYLAVQEGSS